MHISYVSVGATGHVLASLPLVTELVKRGIRVTYFTSENFRAMVEATGAAFSPVDTVLTDQGKADKDVAKNMDAELPLRGFSFTVNIGEFIFRRTRLAFFTSAWCSSRAIT